MILDAILILAMGLILLLLGSSFLVNSTESFSSKYSISGFVASFFLIGVSTSAPDHQLGGDGTGSAIANFTSGDPIDMGHASGELTPLAVMARMARLLDDSQVPEDQRLFVAKPEFYEELASTDSKLMTSDFNQGDGEEPIFNN